MNRDIASKKKKEKEREALLKCGQFGESDTANNQTIKQSFVAMSKA